MNPTTNPSAVRSKKVITETLLMLLNQYSFKEITVKQILLDAKISRKTFYRNFMSKEDVLNSYIDAVLIEYKNAVIETGRFSMLDTFDIIFKFCADNKEMLKILRNNGLLHIPLLKLNALLPSLYKDIGDKAYIIYFNIGGMWNIIIKWIENDMKDSTDRIKEMLIEYLDNIKDINLAKDLK